MLRACVGMGVTKLQLKTPLRARTLHLATVHRKGERNVENVNAHAGRFGGPHRIAPRVNRMLRSPFRLPLQHVHPASACSM